MKFLGWSLYNWLSDLETTTYPLLKMWFDYENDTMHIEDWETITMAKNMR